jgi:hypothetical protein
MYIAIVVLILIALFLIQLLVFGPRQFRKRTKLIAEYTTRNGYRLENPSIMQISSTASARDLLTNPSLKSYIKGSDGIMDIECLEGGTDDPFAFKCTMGTKEAMIFELSVSSQRSDDKGSSLSYKVAKIANEGLPRFSLGMHSAVNTVRNVIDKLAGKSESIIDVDPRNFPEFAKHYWLKGLDSGAVLDFLSPEKMTFLGNTNLEGTIATNSRYFLYFESGSLRSENDYNTFIATVEKLVANLL